MADMHLTKDDVGIIKHVLGSWFEETLDDPSGDLYDEDREQIRRVLAKLPAVKTLPASQPLPSCRELERKDNADLKRLLAKRLKKHPDVKTWPAHWPRP